MDRKQRIFNIIQIGQREDFPSRAFDIILVIAIITNVLVLFLGTFDELAGYFGMFHVVEIITVAIFCVEYALRIWTSDVLYPGRTRGKAIRKFMLSFDGIVELLTILPFFFLTGFVAFRMLRVVRIFHLFKINATDDSFNVIVDVLYTKKNQILSSVFIIFILMLSSSLCMYSAEHAVQPEAFKNAFSGIWWSVSTILTVGYGDIYPITVVGRVMAIIIAILGVGAVAIPTGIISAGFVEEYHKALNEENKPGRMTITMVVEEGTSFCGKTIKAIENEFDVYIELFVRDGLVIMPTDSAVIKAGDTVCYTPLTNR